MMAMRVSIVLSLCIFFTLSLQQTEASPRVPIGAGAKVPKRAAGLRTKLNITQYIWIILFKVSIMTITILMPFSNKSK